MIRIGTSGWVYGDWRGRFYPQGVAQKNWLGYYAQHFDTVELNATTYRLPKPEQVRRWCDAVPQGFAYTVKLSRLITHRKALGPRVDEFIENYMHRAACFDAGKVAQILVQFPPFLERDMAFCVHDYPGCRTPDAVTSTELAYVRLHGYLALYSGNYPRQSLQHWAKRIRVMAERARDVYVYFNNDTLAAAPHDALLLRTLLD